MEKLKVPKLRFKEFGGEWEEKKLDDILQLTLRPIKKPSGGYKALGVRSHAKGTFHKEVENSEDVAIDVLYEVRKDDLIVNITFAWEHAVAICTEADSGRLVSHRFPTYMVKPNLDIKFMSYLIKQEFFRYNLELISPGGAGRNRVMSKSKFLELSMIIPSFPEQQKIADFLSKVDEKIEKLTKKKELLEQYKKGVMQKIFSQELRFKDDNGNDFPEWEEKELGKEAEIYQPKTISQTEMQSDGYFVYGANGIIGFYSEYNHEKEQIAVTCRGNTCGEITYTLPFSWITGNAMVINLDNSLDLLKKYIFYYLKSDNLNYLITGSGQPQITSSIKKHIIQKPSLPEQQKIADFLSTLDKKIDIASQELGQVQEFKKGLLQQMFV